MIEEPIAVPNLTLFGIGALMVVLGLALCSRVLTQPHLFRVLGCWRCYGLACLTGGYNSGILRVRWTSCHVRPRGGSSLQSKRFVSVSLTGRARRDPENELTDI